MVELTDREFEHLSNFVKINFGINLSPNRTFTNLRVNKLMEEAHFDNFMDYFNYACQDMSGLATSNLISSLTINYTQFYREANHFTFLEKQVLPKLAKQEQKTRDLRIWSAGCATGEEPYTIAMVIADFFGLEKFSWDTKILACDISTFALKKAVAGVYPLESIAGLNPAWVAKYFTKSFADPDTVLLSPIIKNEVIFKKMNLVGEPFTFRNKFHCIFCRNVMIYFDEPTKNMLLQRFYDYLGSGGYLFVGTTESIDKSTSKFKYVAPSIYTKE